MLPRDEVTGCLSGIVHRCRHSKSWWRLEGVPVCGVLNSSNSYSTGNPCSKRLAQEVHKLDCFPHGFVMQLLSGKRTVRVCPVRKLLSKRKCLVDLPQFGAARKNGPG